MNHDKEAFANQLRRHGHSAVAAFAATVALAACGESASKNTAADTAASGNVPAASGSKSPDSKPVSEQSSATPTPVQAEMTPSEAQALVDRLAADPSMNPLGLAVKENNVTIPEVVKRDFTDMIQNSDPPFKMPDGVSIEDIIKILPYARVSDEVGSDKTLIGPGKVEDYRVGIGHSVLIEFYPNSGA